MFSIFKKDGRVTIAPSFAAIDYEAIKKASEAAMTERSIKRQLEDQLLAYLYGEEEVAQTRAVEGMPVKRDWVKKEEYPLAMKRRRTSGDDSEYGFPHKNEYNRLINKLYNSYIEANKE